jgi:hypothetical protein
MTTNVREKVTSTTQFWNDVPLSPQDEAQFDRVENVALPIAERRRALHSMVTSVDSVARCVAMDLFTRASADLRHGNQPLVEDGELEAAMRDAAVRELLAPPYLRRDAHATIPRGANHASAFAVVSKDARSEDAVALARALSANADPQVLLEAVKAAEPVLRGEPVAEPELLVALRALWARTDLPEDVRTGAISAVGGADDNVVLTQLMEALRQADLAVSAAAARALLERDRGEYRAVVALVADAWRLPDLPPLDVDEVHQLIADD